MRNNLLPIATVSAFLLATFGVTSTGHNPAPPPSAGVQPPIQIKLKPTAANSGKKKSPGHKDATGDKEKTEEDPVRKAGRLAYQEGHETLKESICTFLAQYGEFKDQTPGAPKEPPHASVSYCIPQPADLAETIGPGDIPQPGPAVHPKVVLAILPDPVHTQLALRFDQSIDELQNSMQDLGWVFDRAWLPWENKDHEDAADFDQRMENKRGQESYETSAGAIMFRPDPDPDKGTTQPLIVLLAADSPTGGVNAAQFKDAISIWQQLTGWNDYLASPYPPAKNASTPEAAGLQILGPTFSGSLPSLKALLRATTEQFGTGTEERVGYFCPSHPFTVSIASGSVSDSVGLTNLESSGLCRIPLTVDIRSLAVDIDYEYTRMLAFLQSHQALFGNDRDAEAKDSQPTGDGCSAREKDPSPAQEPPFKVARLTEAESVYGERFFVAPDQDWCQIAQKALANRASLEIPYTPEVIRYWNNVIANYPRQVKARDLTNQLQPLHFYFPREISKLRAAYEQNNIFGFNSNSSSVHTQLHLSLSRSSREDDTVHTFSGDQGAAVQESAMAQLAAELDRQKVTIVILSATDVLDELFVTRYLAQHTPNISVIVTDTDGLFLRGADASMQNAYVVSPWSLLPGDEEWSQPPAVPAPMYDKLPPWDQTSWPDHAFRDHRVHDSADGQGLYSATRFLICDPDPKPLKLCGAVPNPNNSDPRHPFLRKVSLTQYRAPVATSAAITNDLVDGPPLWLSAVGRGGFWPIALVNLDQAGDGLPETMDTNMPRLIKIDHYPAGSAKPLDPPLSRGIHEKTSRSITIASGIIALLLAFHGLASIWARLDRGFAWSYALSDLAHHQLRRILQILIALSAIPALVLLKTPSQAGVDICGPDYAAINWLLQSAAILLTLWPLVQFIGAWPWPWSPAQRTCNFLKLAAAVGLELLFLIACNYWLWEVVAPSPSRLPSERAFFFYRSGHLFSGSAPNLPLLLLGGALVLFLVGIFDRLVFFTNRIPRLPNSDPSLRCPDEEAVARLNGLLSDHLNRWRVVLLVAVVVILLLFIFGLPEMVPRSLAHGRFDVVIVAMSALVMFLLVYDLAMAVAAWVFLRADCLLPLSHSPLRWGFTWIKGWSWKRVLTPGAFSADRVVEYLRRLDEINRRSKEDPWLTNAFFNSRARFLAPPRNATWAAGVTQSVGKLNVQIAKTATDKLAALKVLWGRDYGPVTGSAAERGMRDEIPIDKYSGDNPSDNAAWRASHDRMAAEEFVALLYLGYIRMVLLQIRNRIMTATGMYVLLMWALTSYPFLNHHFILVGLSCLLAGLAVTVIWIYAQMHRDDILSRTTETTAGQLDSEFFTKILSLVGIPMLTLIASQFPEVSNAVFSWLEPGLSSMK